MKIPNRSSEVAHWFDYHKKYKTGRMWVLILLPVFIVMFLIFYPTESQKDNYRKYDKVLFTREFDFTRMDSVTKEMLQSVSDRLVPFDGSFGDYKTNSTMHNFKDEKLKKLYITESRSQFFILNYISQTEKYKMAIPTKWQCIANITLKYPDFTTKHLYSSFTLNENKRGPSAFETTFYYLSDRELLEDFWLFYLFGNAAIFLISFLLYVTYGKDILEMEREFKVNKWVAGNYDRNIYTSPGSKLISELEDDAIAETDLVFIHANGREYTVCKYYGPKNGGE